MIPLRYFVAVALFAMTAAILFKPTMGFEILFILPALEVYAFASILIAVWRMTLALQAGLWIGTVFSIEIAFRMLSFIGYNPVVHSRAMLLPYTVATGLAVWLCAAGAWRLADLGCSKFRGASRDRTGLQTSYLIALAVTGTTINQIMARLLFDPSGTVRTFPFLIFILMTTLEAMVFTTAIWRLATSVSRETWTAVFVLLGLVYSNALFIAKLARSYGLFGMPRGLWTDYGQEWIGGPLVAALSAMAVWRLSSLVVGASRTAPSVATGAA